MNSNKRVKLSKRSQAFRMALREVRRERMNSVREASVKMAATVRRP